MLIVLDSLLIIQQANLSACLLVLQQALLWFLELGGVPSQFLYMGVVPWSTASLKGH